MSCDWDQPVNIDVTKKVGVYEDGIPSRLRTIEGPSRTDASRRDTSVVAARGVES